MRVGLVPNPGRRSTASPPGGRWGNGFGTDGTRDLIAYRNLGRQTNTPLFAWASGGIVQRQDVDPATAGHGLPHDENGFGQDAKLR